MVSCAALLVVSGIPKIRRPAATIAALRSVGATWVGANTVRTLSLVEVAAGVVAVVAGGPWADGAVAILYAGFTIFLIRALATPAASCGCTARDDTPPTAAHLAMTMVFCLGACAAVAAGGRTGVVDLWQGGRQSEVVVVLGFALIVTWLGHAILTFSRRIPTPRRG
jgi:hypothetical protein